MFEIRFIWLNLFFYVGQDLLYIYFRKQVTYERRKSCAYRRLESHWHFCNSNINLVTDLSSVHTNCILPIESCVFIITHTVQFQTRSSNCYFLQSLQMCLVFYWENSPVRRILFQSKIKGTKIHQNQLSFIFVCDVNRCYPNYHVHLG